MPKFKNNNPAFDDVCIYGCSIIGGFLSFGCTLYGLYHFLPVWFDSLLAFVLLTPFVVLITGLLVTAGMLAGMMLGTCLYLICTSVLGLFSFLNAIPQNNRITKKTAKPIKPTKEKIELIVGLVVMGCTAALIGVGVFTSVPNDGIIAAWLILTGMTAYIGNRYLTKIQSQS
ncbi:hypothetical protein SAMN02745664_101291 [Moraxella cuniculi DSM 21768]|uniref:Uncharacterized protein n=1 Tax=Moraxella cuniculi DSM 21768 TaxID=1122245 RepID=A0A1N7DIH4_9GAMM|nr:hypothetical protein [Moraxella cuniculi]OOS08084.1 hypothetical protein B0189_01760 [Moraxella cuniculi]SIR75601.1 hypothetical protein SAMN02745664_101291 [Moraxella cuniculi DSM 21768]